MKVFISRHCYIVVNNNGRDTKVDFIPLFEGLDVFFRLAFCLISGKYKANKKTHIEEEVAYEPLAQAHSLTTDARGSVRSMSRGTCHGSPNVQSLS